MVLVAKRLRTAALVYTFNWVGKTSQHYEYTELDFVKSSKQRWYEYTEHVDYVKKKTMCN